jgi:hypothetical protein
MSQFNIEAENPNEKVGGGACLGNGDEKSVDCTGPYVVFYAAATDSNSSPHAVLCAACLAEVMHSLGEDAQEAEVLDLPAESVVEEAPEDADIPEV